MAEVKKSVYAPSAANQGAAAQIKWKDAPEQTPAEQWGTTNNPVKETPTPFKNLKSVGG